MKARAFLQGQNMVVIQEHAGVQLKCDEMSEIRVTVSHKAQATSLLPPVCGFMRPTLRLSFLVCVAWVGVSYSGSLAPWIGH